MDGLQMLEEMYGCGLGACMALIYIREKGDLKEKGDIKELLPSLEDMDYDLMGRPAKKYCFRIPANGSDSRFDAISISVPPGSQFGRPNHEIVVKPITEIALIKDTKLVYVDELGYDDVQKFSDFESLLEEVKRLLSL
jgi:hypothetical protein